jgi:hypothetical protein
MGVAVPVEALEPAQFWVERRAAFKVLRYLTVLTHVACVAGGPDRDAIQRNGCCAKTVMLGGVRFGSSFVRCASQAAS